jgi:hypothetical protein
MVSRPHPAKTTHVPIRTRNQSDFFITDLLVLSNE